MKHKLYTTYQGNHRNYPENCQIVLIMRFPPFVPKDGDIFHAKELSPKAKLLNQYKSGEIDFEEFKAQLWIQWESNEEGAMDTLKEIEQALDEVIDVCLVCCEKELEGCHRKILGEHFKFLGYEWEEVPHE